MSLMSPNGASIPTKNLLDKFNEFNDFNDKVEETEKSFKLINDLIHLRLLGAALEAGKLAILLKGGMLDVIGKVVKHFEPELAFKTKEEVNKFIDSMIPFVLDKEKSKPTVTGLVEFIEKQQLQKEQLLQEEESSVNTAEALTGKQETGMTGMFM